MDASLKGLFACLENRENFTERDVSCVTELSIVDSDPDEETKGFASCPLLALSGHSSSADQCAFGVKA